MVLSSSLWIITALFLGGVGVGVGDGKVPSVMRGSSVLGS